MDWTEMLADLRDRGWTQKLLAEHCKVSQSSISAIATGTTKDPAHSLGTKLQVLFDAGTPPELAPTTAEAGG